MTGRWLESGVSRRKMLTGGLAAAGGALAIGGASAIRAQAPDTAANAAHADHAGHPAAATNEATHAHGAMMTVGSVDPVRNGFDPTAMLTDWDTGTVEIQPDGTRLRSWYIIAEDKEIEIAPGVFFPAWTYNGRVPGPTLRATEGDRLQITFVNAGSHPHSIHFHGIHAARMDGVPGAGEVRPGETFVYEFNAEPFGCHLYHCHSMPLKRHIHKGLYGAFIVDPDPARHPEFEAAARSRLLGSPENAGWQEMVMVMNGFDTNFDNENEVYAANTVAHEFMRKPVRIERQRPVRVYLINLVEFDPINSFHLHGNFFDYYDHGTQLVPTLKTVDTIMQCQAQRGILEFTFGRHETGQYMFHAHQSELAELGWMGMFDVVDAESVA